MADTVRMNLNVDPDVPDMLTQLAGGNKRMGAYLSQLVRQAAESQSAIGKPGEVDMLMSAVMHLSAKVKELDSRVTQLEERR